MHDWLLLNRTERPCEVRELSCYYAWYEVEIRLVTIQSPAGRSRHVTNVRSGILASSISIGRFGLPESMTATQTSMVSCTCLLAIRFHHARRVTMLCAKSASTSSLFAASAPSTFLRSFKGSRVIFASTSDGSVC